MIDKWKKAVDNNKVFLALLTDLSKAPDCICHDLLVAKLYAYGLSLPTLKIIQEYPLNQKQRTKIGSSFSSWENIRSGVPQGSILGPLLLNIYLCELFLEHEDCCFTNYADDTKLVANNTAEVIENLTIITPKLFTWFTWFYSCRYQNQNFSLVSHSSCTHVVRVAIMLILSHSCC